MKEQGYAELILRFLRTVVIIDVSLAAVDTLARSARALRLREEKNIQGS